MGDSCKVNGGGGKGGGGWGHMVMHSLGVGFLLR